uniref:uncharacterized protein LOC108950300 isoform X2 n=1 Tax=Ciona intestinalis TaxID=7719 RepID=UPI000EF44FC6|nr:uncharacterized protein LOC108950300 isoform X2 [Ciona intestinalis]|eukprot:XP_026694407.1 uncharacterized protein LOC108950300 isoform X2 [Ciona intestinalis]
MENIHKTSVALIGAELLPPKPNAVVPNVTIHKPVAKIIPTLAATMVGEERAGAISRAGHHRWPQATMRVMGATKRQVYNTELLTVTTRQRDMDLLKKGSKHTDEDTSPTKPIFPNISGGQTQETEGKGRNSQSPQTRLTSPTKFTQFPRFQRGSTTANAKSLVKQEQQTKLIRNIKFWRGTTPATRENHRELKEVSNKEHFVKTEQQKEDSFQSWTEQVTSLEEISKHKYFSWHMALRERLMKHEKLHYDEAVTRINKYRERLRKRPAFPSNSSEIRVSKDNQLIRSLLQDGNKKQVTTTITSGVRMSPSKQWRPYIGSEEGENGQKKPPFFGKSAATANEAAKKQFKQTNNLTSSKGVRKSRYSTSSKDGSSYPIHGEGLLKSEQENVLPSIDTTSPTEENSNQKVENEVVQSEDIDVDEDKAETRALLVDLKRHLKSGQAGDGSDGGKTLVERGSTAPVMQTRTGMGAKLRLLLQSSSQSPRDHGNDGSQKISTGKRKSQSQNGKLRPLTRPHTYGSGTLPKITNLPVTSLWKNHQTNAEHVKHRLTLKGIANRESFTPGMIGVSKKHINSRGRQSDENQKINEPENDEKINTNNKANETSQKTVNAKEVNSSQKESVTAGNESFSRGWKRGVVAHKLHTPVSQQQQKPIATSALLAKSYRYDIRENPQHMDLKLVTSHPNQPSATPDHDTSKHRIKGKKKTVAQHKVLCVAVVEPPLTERERHRRQQELERSSKRLTFNPTHAAVSSFTAAILNSELALRAPSSSPVDMVYRHYNPIPNEQPTTADLWTMRKAAVEQLQNLPEDQAPLVEALLQNHNEQLLINSTDAPHRTKSEGSGRSAETLPCNEEAWGGIHQQWNGVRVQQLSYKDGEWS